MKDRMTDALKAATADYCEIRFETNDKTRVVLRGDEVEHVGSSKGAGGLVRACTKGGWAVATFDDANDLPHFVREACEAAALVGNETTELADVEPIDAAIEADLVRDFRGVALDEKLDLVTHYNALLLKGDPAVATTATSYGEAFRTVWFANTRGSVFSEERPYVVLVLRATAKNGSLVQQAHESFSSSRDFGAVTGREADAEAVAKRAADLLKAPACPGGATTVVCDPKLAGVFAHEAFGHLSEADHLYENPPMRDLMRTGRQIGVKALSIADEGARPGLIGSVTYDDEGTPGGKTYLIKEGTLVGHLHSLETAAKMGEAPTGNARAISRHYPPIVRMTNTYIEPGDVPFGELLAGIDRGVYACGNIGGQTMLEQFTFSAAYGYRIENGQVGELVRDVVLTGNVFETLNQMDAFGDDFALFEMGGGCGKGGQSPLPVTFGSPHIRIRDVVIGGRA